MFIKIKPVIKSSVVKSFITAIVAAFAAGTIVFAWTEPGSAPPSGNVAGPINTSGGTQTKAGDLVLPNLYLNAIGSEGNIYNANIVQGYNDLFLRSNSAENATLYLSGSQLDFWSGTPSQPRWSINSAGTLNIGSVPWARLISLPSACPAGQYVSAVGSSLTCSAPPGGGSQWTTSGSNIYYTSGNVGIGVAGPISKLWVGNSVSDPFLVRLMSGTGAVGDKTGIGFGANWAFSKAGIYFENLGSNTGNLVFANTNQTDAADFYLVDAYKRMVITPAGSVGIGTAAPNAKLAVGGAGSAGDAVAAYANSANSALYAEQTGTGYAGYFTGKVRFSSDIIVANMGSCPILKTGATGLLSCNFSSYLTSEADPQVGTITTSGKWCTTDGSQINCASDAPSGGVGGSGADNYLPRWNGTGALESSVIYQKDTGEIGIGTASPGALLHVSGNAAGTAARITGSSGSYDTVFSQLDFHNSNADGIASVRAVTGPATLGYGGGQLGFFTAISSQGGSPTEKVRITGTGNVGIGTAAPSAKLAVGGAGSAGDAVAAYANSANSALYAEQAGTGYAGYFSGKAHVSTNLTVGGLTNCANLKTNSAGLLSCNATSYLTSEADPQVGTITTSGKWCTTDGSQINCASDAPSGGVGGSGTANSVPKFTAGTTLGNSIIYDNGIGVGIGTTAPGALLNTYNANSGDQLKLQLSSNGQDNYTGIKFTFGGTDRARIEVYQPRPQAYGDMNFYTAGSDGLNNRMTVKYTGNVGIGDTSPASLLTVGSGDLFQVNSSGNLVKVNNVSYSWPASQGSASTYLKNDGSGNLSWTAAAGGGVNSYAYSSNAALDIIPPNFDWQDITSRTLSNVPANTLLVIDASASIQMLYNNWPDGVSTVLNGRMRITVNGTEQKICYVNSPATTGWDYGNCSINTVFLTPAAGNYTVRLQGRKINADHQASFFYTDLRVVGLPYTP